MPKPRHRKSINWLLTSITALVVIALAFLIYRLFIYRPPLVPEFVLNGVMRQIPATPEPLSSVSVTWLDKNSAGQTYSARGLRWDGPASELNPIWETIGDYFREIKFKSDENNISVGTLESTVSFQSRNVACLLKISLAGPDESLGIEDLLQRTDAPQIVEVLCFSLK